MFTVKMDSQFSRRQRLHHIYNETGERKASHQKIGDVIRWLIDHDIRTVCIEDDRSRYVMEIEPYPW